MRLISRIVSALLFALVAYQAPAQVRVLQVTGGTGENSRLESIVARTVSIEIEHAGMVSVLPENGKWDASANSLRASARKENAQYVLSVRYREVGTNLSLDMSLMRVSDEKQIDAKSLDVPIDLNLDAAVTSAVRSLLSDSSVVREVAAARAAQKNTKVSTKTLESRGSNTASPTVAPRNEPRGISLALGAAPLILVGTSSDYFRYGISVQFTAGYRFPIGGLSALIGLGTTGLRIFPVPDLPQGTVYAIDAGPSLQIGTPASSAATISLEIFGGASVLAAQLPGGPLLAKTIPFVEAGILARLHISRKVVLGARIGYLTVFEEAYPVMGVSPAITVGIEP